VRSCGGGVGVGGKVVVFGSAVVRALGHWSSPSRLDAADSEAESAAELAQVVVGVEVAPAHPLGGGHSAEHRVRRPGS
jgi:hypothetical protein